MRTIEENVPFAQSAVWSFQRQYYSQTATDAWSKKKIPHYITDNPVIGRAYANIVIGFLRDIRQQNMDTVYILEIGAGHGCFTYRFLKHFDRMRSLLNLPPICYVASDLVPKNIEFLEANPKLRPFIESGMLDFAVWDAENDTKIVLRRSKMVIEKGSLSQPLIVIANYVMDTIKPDLFYINDNQINTCLLTIQTQPDELSCNVFDELSIVSSCKKLDEPAFDEQYLCDILGDYRDLRDTYLLFPSSGIRAVERLRSLTSGGLMLLTCDKGYNCRYQLSGLPFPEFVSHDNAFSLMVNYHAFHEYCENSCGLVLSPGQKHMSVSVECLLFVEQAENYKETQMAYKASVDGYGPDEFCAISSLLSSQITEINFEQWVSIIRHSGYDADVFLRFLHPLYDLIGTLQLEWKRSLIGIARKVWDMHYPLDKAPDIALELGKVLIIAGFPEEAVEYFKLSIDAGGYDSEAVQNLMFCYCHIKDYDSGIQLLETLRRENLQTTI